MLRKRSSLFNSIAYSRAKSKRLMLFIPCETDAHYAYRFQEIKTEQNDASKTEVFACPVCYEPLIRKGPSGVNPVCL